MTLTKHIQLQRAVVTAEEENRKPQLPDALFSVKTARYTTYHMGGKLAVRPFDLCSFRMILFVNVFARGG